MRPSAAHTHSTPPSFFSSFPYLFVTLSTPLAPLTFVAAGLSAGSREAERNRGFRRNSRAVAARATGRRRTRERAFVSYRSYPRPCANCVLLLCAFTKSTPSLSPLPLPFLLPPTAFSLPSYCLSLVAYSFLPPLLSSRRLVSLPWSQGARGDRQVGTGGSGGCNTQQQLEVCLG